MITASPDNRVRGSSFHNATLSSVWPGVVSTVRAAALGNGAPSSRPPAGRGWRQSMPLDVPVASFWVFMRTALRRGNMARAIDELARRRAQLPVAEIVATLRGCADHPLSPPLFGPLDPLADILIHGGDIRIPLNLPFEPEPELAALALDFLTGRWPFGFVPLGRLWGISLRGCRRRR